MDESTLDYSDRIATASIGEGLDFACNLLSDKLELAANSTPAAAPRLLQTIAQYISFRYAGEDELAFDALAFLGRELHRDDTPRSQQFWKQLKWAANQLGIPVNDEREGGLTSRLT